MALDRLEEPGEMSGTKPETMYYSPFAKDHTFLVGLVYFKNNIIVCNNTGANALFGMVSALIKCFFSSLCSQV